jgi:hypothetical protein
MFSWSIHYRIGVDREVGGPPVKCGVGANVVIEMAGEVECDEVIWFF